MSRAIAIEFAIHFAIQFRVEFGVDVAIHTLRDMGYEKNSSLDLSNFSDICDALKLCRDPTSPVEIELLFYSC